jgi:hypothetical protein
MTTKHTPGPWKVRGQAGYAGHGVNDINGRSICSVPSNGNRDHAERNANVALLAAAPELLEALEFAFLCLKSQVIRNRKDPADDLECQIVSAAINKATGG